MKHLTLTLLLVLTLTACSSLPASSPTPLPTIALAPVSTDGLSTGAITASAVIVPARQAQLSFPAVGRIKSVEVQVGDKVKAGEALAYLDTALLEARVREAESNLAAAEVQVAFLKRVGTDERNLDSAEADVERAQALLDSAKATLAYQSSLIAPFDGTIVRVDVAAGETAVPGRVAILLGDLSYYKIETTDLSERDVTRIKIGQAAQIRIEALGQEFSGRVTDIALISSTLGGDVVFTVTIELDEQPKGLLWGMSADVEIQVE